MEQYMGPEKNVMGMESEKFDAEGNERKTWTMPDGTTYYGSEKEFNTLGMPGWREDQNEQK